MRTSLAPDVGAPSQARTFLATQLGAARLPEGVRLDKVILIASELVTNSVQAGATAVEIGVHVTEQRLDLVVIDDADGWPTPISAAASDTTGRGLSIVEQLTDTWVVTAKTHGKAVTASWFGLRDHRTRTAL